MWQHRRRRRNARHGEDTLTESVWDYPRPPALQPCGHRVRIELGGVMVADSTAALRVLETSHPPTIYVPSADIARGCIKPASGRSFCEWKATASYLDVVAGGRHEVRTAWTYRDPVPAYAALRGPFKGAPEPPGGSGVGAGPPFRALRADRPLISRAGTLLCVPQG